MAQTLQRVAIDPVFANCSLRLKFVDEWLPTKIAARMKAFGIQVDVLVVTTASHPYVADILVRLKL